MARSLINSAGARQRCRKLSFASFGAVTRLARTRGTAIALGAIALACAAWLAIAAGASTASGSTTPVAVVTLTGQSRSIPRSFFGLSIEDEELAKYEAEEPLFDLMISHLAPLDGSRMLLRLGGRSADEVFWDTPTTGQPRWVRDLDPAWMDRLAKLARRNNLRVELDLNMAVHSPKMETAFATCGQKGAARATGRLRARKRTRPVPPRIMAREGARSEHDPLDPAPLDPSLRDRSVPR